MLFSMKNIKTFDPARIRALAVDLDGTILLPDTTMSERMARALSACIARGIQVIICTGRALEAVEKYREPLGAAGPMVYFNGAEVVDMPQGAVLSATLLEKEVVEYCVELSRTMGVYYQAYFPGTPDKPRGFLMAERNTEEAAMYFRHTGIQAVIGNIGEALAASPAGCIKGMFLSEPELHDTLRQNLIHRFGNRIYVARTLRTFLEVMDARVSKGAGLRLAMKQRGLCRQDVIAFGDEESDLPLFSESAYSVAPANAKEQVRDSADLVVGSNAEDGVAAFLESAFGL
jgi:Cof subfamily protein (haloacid dehalogenase superfamily)